jgi:hypothetical protein
MVLGEWEDPRARGSVLTVRQAVAYLKTLVAIGHI